jgi:hypothetical protein
VEATQLSIIGTPGSVNPSAATKLTKTSRKVIGRSPGRVVFIACRTCLAV